MKKLVVFVLVFSLFVSCKKENRPEKPQNLIPKDQMVNIILDMSILTAAKGVNRVALEDKGIMPEDFVYKKYGIDSLQFAASNNYYAHHIQEYEDIYLIVNDSLKALKDRLKEEQDEVFEAKRIADSIAKNSKIKSPKPTEGKVAPKVHVDSLKQNK